MEDADRCPRSALVVREIRRAILCSPRCRAAEAEIAQHVRVSRSPVREGAARGRRAYHQPSPPGDHGHHLSPEDAADIAGLRAHLEVLAYGLVLPALPEPDLTHLETIIGRMAVTGDDLAATIELDLQFHGFLTEEKPGRRRPIDPYHPQDGLVWTLALVARNWGVTARDVPQHHAGLLRAWLAPDAALAPEAIIQHY